MTLAFPKPEKPKRGTADAKRYLSLVAMLPCVCCGRHYVVCHHPIHGRHSQGKSSDLDVIPLCPEHHAELHAYPADWKAKYGEDRDFVPATRLAVEKLRRNLIGGR